MTHNRFKVNSLFSCCDAFLARSASCCVRTEFINYKKCVYHTSILFSVAHCNMHSLSCLRTQCHSNVHTKWYSQMIKSQIITRISRFAVPKMSAINQSWSRCKNFFKIFYKKNFEAKNNLIGLSQKMKISILENFSDQIAWNFNDSQSC
jgi:hypothetical protein